jgi:hypothetical protein
MSFMALHTLLRMSTGAPGVLLSSVAGVSRTIG